jgi:hypothetical protein
MWYVITLQDHRYLDPPILGVQRRFRVKCQHQVQLVFVSGRLRIWRGVVEESLIFLVLFKGTLSL